MSTVNIKIYKKLGYVDNLPKSEKVLLDLISNGMPLERLMQSSPTRNVKLINSLYNLEKRGIISLNIESSSPVLKKIYKALHSIDQSCIKEPGMNNIIGWEYEWSKYYNLFDILDPHSEQYYLKLLEKEIYMYYISPYLKKIKTNANILDVGGGVGRFAIELGRRGYKISLVDASETSLKVALKYFIKNKIKDFSLYLHDIDNIDDLFMNETFDAVFGIEAICYATNPEKVLRKLLKVTKKGGFLFLSVEGLYGSILSDPQIPIDKMHDILTTGILPIQKNVFTHYYTKDSFRKLVEKCGVKDSTIYGTHYVPEGPFNRLIDMEKLRLKSYRKYIIKLEKWFASTPAFNELARSWLGIIKK